MKHKFSSDLILKCKQLVKKRVDVEISDGEAELYLNQLARLGELVVKVLKTENEAQELANSNK